MNIKELQIDEEFQNLIAPLQRKEFLQLEENILEDGCLNPIITWKGFIIDGHNRYNICTKHDIPFDTIEKEFVCRDAVIAWICKNQLGRRNISEETRKYLIDLLEIVSIAGIDESCIKNALNSSWKDFEDAVQHESSLQIGADYIVSRNIADYKNSFVEVIAPSDFLVKFK